METLEQKLKRLEEKRADLSRHQAHYQLIANNHEDEIVRLDSEIAATKRAMEEEGNRLGIYADGDKLFIDDEGYFYLHNANAAAGCAAKLQKHIDSLLARRETEVRREVAEKLNHEATQQAGGSNPHCAYVLGKHADEIAKGGAQ